MYEAPSRKRVVTVLFGSYYLGAEELCFGSGDVIFEDPINEYLALLIDEYHRTYHI
jgi:hypothetical protein